MSNIVNNLVEDYIRTTLKEKDGLLRELEEYANEHNVPIVHKEVSELLKVLLKIQKPKRILEVGCAIGYSSILFASVLDEDVEIITVERNEKMIEKAKENIKLAGFEKNITILEGDAEEILKEVEGPFDMIFMDAAKGQYKLFYDMIIDKLRVDGLLISDNILYKGMVAHDDFVIRRKKTIVKRMRNYLDYICNCDYLSTSLIPIAFNLDSLKLNIENGCDAVYIGDELKNFSIDELKKSVEYAHNRDKKVYVSLNKIPHENDINEIKRYIKSLIDTGIDAIVVIEPGMLTIVRDVCENIEIHLSDQANVTNYETASFWYNQGIKRVIVSKELSCEEIGQIRLKSPIDMDIEALVHGALFISHSGRKLLSNFLKGKNADENNRINSKKYNLVEEKRPGKYFPVYEDERGTFLFNTEDLCMIEYIPELIKCGITSLRIDGKMKDDEYVATAVKAYRKAIDAFYSDPNSWEFNPIWLEDLNKLNNRNLTSGFYLDNPNKDE